MPTEHRSSFLLVRSYADLERCNDDLAAYLSILSGRSPVYDFECLQGVWIDEEGVANLPDALVLPDANGVQRTVRILEATGINGIWMLCGLEAMASRFPRVDLLEALLMCFAHEETATLAAGFIPIVANQAPDFNTSAELQMLEERYPGLILPTIYQDASGRLVLPSVQPRPEGTRS